MPVTDIEKAVAFLNQEYDKALSLEFVRDPISYALYKTWRYFDSKHKKQKKTAAEKEIKINSKTAKEDFSLDVCPTCGAKAVLLSKTSYPTDPFEKVKIRYENKCEICGTEVVADELNELKIKWYKLWKGMPEE